MLSQITVWIQKFCLCLLVMLIVFGGSRFSFIGAKLELAQVDLWMVPLLLLTLLGMADWSLLKIERFIRALASPKKVAVIIGVCSLVLTGVHFLRHASLATQIWDVGSMHQGLYHFFPKSDQSMFFQCDVCLGQTNLGEHLVFSTAFLGALFSPLKSIFGNADFFLFFLQSIFLLVPFVLFGFQDQSIRNRPERYIFIASLVVICFSQRWYRSNFFWDFREDLVAYVFLSFSLFALQRGSQMGFIFSICMALATKESVPLITGALGVALLLDKKNFLHPWGKKTRIVLGGLACALSLSYLFLSTKFLIPFFSGGLAQSAEHPILFRFKEFGKTPNEILSNILKQPWVLWPLVQERITDGSVYRYFLFLIAPIGIFLFSKGLFKKSWPYYLPLAVGIGLNLLPEMKAHRSFQFHYELLFAPFVFLLLAKGIQNHLRENGKKKIWMGILIALCLSGRWPGYFVQKYWPQNGLEDFQVSSYLRNIEEKMNLSGAVIAANESWYAQITHLNSLRRIQLDSRQNSEELKGALSAEQIAQFVLDFQNRNQWGTRRSRGQDLSDATVWLLDLRDPQERLLSQIFFQLGLEQRVTPDFPEDLRKRVAIFSGKVDFSRLSPIWGL